MDLDARNAVMAFLINFAYPPPVVRKSRRPWRPALFVDQKDCETRSSTVIAQKSRMVAVSCEQLSGDDRGCRVSAYISNVTLHTVIWAGLNRKCNLRRRAQTPNSLPSKNVTSSTALDRIDESSRNNNEGTPTTAKMLRKAVATQSSKSTARLNALHLWCEL